MVVYVLRGVEREVEDYINYTSLDSSQILSPRVHIYHQGKIFLKL